MNALWRRMLELLRPAQLDREAVEELSHHVDLLVEQNINKALEVAHHAYVIEQGSIVTSGEPDALLNNPRIREAYLGI